MYTGALIKLWVLAGKLMMKPLQNQIILKIDEVRLTEKKLPFHYNRYVCNNTTKDSPLRRYFVDLCITHVPKETFVGKNESFSHEMLAEVIFALKGEMSWMVIASFDPAEDLSAYKVPED